ncbi:HNH endonuclease [Campylobacter mucosalis]|uniref:HNH endonuclease n=1 Tax=Campylobacter mucosalis TaxID=202 RepID=UPI00147039EC|nr:hypothetical protein [Campylobacter mucosalis]
MTRDDIVNNIYKNVRTDTYRLKNVKITEDIKKFGFDDDGYISFDIINLSSDAIIKKIANSKSPFESKMIEIYNKAYENVVSKKFAKDIVLFKNYHICPYCKVNYIKMQDGIARPDLDHFYPKRKFFYLAITFDNLVPSCTLCNQRLKRDKDPVINFYKTQNIFKKIQFECDIINKYIYISNIDDFDCSEKEWIRDMKTQEIYSMHTEIFDNIYEKYEKYRKSNIKDMAACLNLDEKYIKDIVFAEYKIMKERNEPLYKLKQDLFKQISTQFQQ